MTITNHRLDNTEFIQAGTKPFTITPHLIVIHYTATRTIDGVLKLFQKGGAVSAHLVIDTDGRVVQMVDFNQRASHAGRSEYLGRKACNDFSIGIELVNPGPLHGLNTGLRSVVDNKAWDGPTYWGVHENPNCGFKWWAAYPEEQISVLCSIVKELKTFYRIPDVYGHEHVSPNRKIDPGPAFPWSRIREITI